MLPLVAGIPDGKSFRRWFLETNLRAEAVRTYRIPETGTRKYGPSGWLSEIAVGRSSRSRRQGFAGSKPEERTSTSGLPQDMGSPRIFHPGGVGQTTRTERGRLRGWNER
jgi:hypothetical protein